MDNPIVIEEVSIVFPSLERTFKTKWWDGLKNAASSLNIKNFIRIMPSP